MKNTLHKEQTGSPAQPYVLVYLTGALGDLVLSTPALALLRSVFAGTHVHGIVPASLATLYPQLFDSVTLVDSAAVTGLFGAHARDALKAHPVWREARKVVVLEPPTSVLASALQATGKIEVMCIDARPSQCHEEHYARWLWRHTAEMLEAVPEFTVPIPHTTPPAELPQSTFGMIHPGSGSVSKNCPAARLAAACGEYKAAELMVFEGENDGEAVASFVRSCSVPPRVMQHVPLPELAWYLKYASFYIGNDSGISHLAGAVGARGIAFFGRSDPQVWRPLGSGIEIRRFI